MALRQRPVPSGLAVRSGNIRNHSKASKLGLRKAESLARLAWRGIWGAWFIEFVSFWFVKMVPQQWSMR